MINQSLATMPAGRRIPVRPKLMRPRVSVGRIAFAVTFWFYGVLTCQDSFSVFITLPILAVALYNLGKIQTDVFSRDDMFWFCILVFFVIGPCQSLNNGVFGVNAAASAVTYTDLELFKASSLVFLSLLVFTIATSVKLKQRAVIFRNFNQTQIYEGRGVGYLILLVGIMLCSFVAYVYTAGDLSNVLASRSDKIEARYGVLSVCFLSMQIIATVAIAIRCRLDRERDGGFVSFSSFSVFLIACICLLISVNPTNIPRFMFVATWVPVALAFFGDRARYVWVYSLMLFGLLVAMPVMSITSRGGLASFDSFYNSNYARDFFVIKDIDVFDTFVHTIRYVGDAGYMFGKNVLATALFFVPRAIWAAKPVVGGLIVGDDLYYRYGAMTSNLSYYIGGDFYLDFGILGLVFGFYGLGRLWNWVTQFNLNFMGVDIIGLCVIGSIPILLRGPVGAVEGFFISQVFAIIALRYIMNRFSPNRMEIRPMPRR